MKALYFKIVEKLDALQSLPLLIIRLILAYGFYQTAKIKVGNEAAIAEWFGSLNIPAPVFNAYLATYTEVFGVVFLIIGFAVRFISIPLTIMMIVAIKTVHWANGFNASDNGYEIPLYFMIMLSVLLFNGGGKLSIDYLISKKVKKD